MICIFFMDGFYPYTCKAVICALYVSHLPSDFTIAITGFRMLALFVSVIYPLIIISSIIKCAFSMLNMMSSSQTFSKYLSSVSTKLWINSRKLNSFYSREWLGIRWCLTYHFLFVVDTDDEVQRCIATIDHLVLSMLQKATLVLCAT